MPHILRDRISGGHDNDTIPNDFFQNAVFAEPTDEMVVVKDIEMFR